MDIKDKNTTSETIENKGNTKYGLKGNVESGTKSVTEYMFNTSECVSPIKVAIGKKYVTDNTNAASNR